MKYFSFHHERSREFRIDNWFAGLHINSVCRRIETALIGLEGCQADSQVILQKNMSFDLPDEISSAFETIQQQFMEEPRRLAQWSLLTSNAGAEIPINNEVRSTQNISSVPESKQKSDGDSISSNNNLLRDMETLTIMLTSVAEEAVEELLADSDLQRDKVSLLTVSNPGIWVDTVWGVTCRELCNAGHLAVKTGLNILDALPDKDVAVSGQGRPLYAFPYWIYLNHFEQNRLLIDLGQTARLTFIPRSNGETPWKEIEFFDGIPCGNLLDFFTQQISRGKIKTDVGGRLSVQGRCIPELVQKWSCLEAEIEKLSATDFGSLFLTPFNTIYPFLNLINEMVQSNQWSLADMLCSFVHWIAETIVHKIQKSSFGKENRPFDIIITGNARQNGLLFNRLSMAFHSKRIDSLEKLKFPEESFDAMSAAMLGVLFQCRIPMNLPHLTNADQAVLLGKMTPGGKRSVC